MTSRKRLSVLFVCTGNYCRSPTAEAIFLQLVHQHGLSDRIHVDSAGTHDYFVDVAPDPRSVTHASRRGFELRELRGRQVEAKDFESFDLLLVMDQGNMAHMAAICPAEHRKKLRYFLEFAPEAGRIDVPDPYSGGPPDFERVLDLVELGAQGLLAHLREQLALPGRTPNP